MGTDVDLQTPRGRRAFVIELCRRRQRPGSGSDLVALMEGAPLMHWPDLRELLDPIPWAVIGAVAARLYMPERATKDIDIMVADQDLSAAEHRLAEADWGRLGDLAVGGSTWRSPKGTQLVLLSCAEPWCHEALTEAQQNRDPEGLPVIPLPHLVLLKLASSRTTDVGDLCRMLGLADDAALERVREAVRKHAPEDLEDLEALVELGRLETTR